jgi:1-acyl-sn-glycerol-3-phosphate acyltransferase
MEATALVRNSLAFMARVLSGASVRWIDSQPDTCQRVYFANHTSHLDAIVLWSALPQLVRRLTRPVAAKAGGRRRSPAALALPTAAGRPEGIRGTPPA